MAKSIAFKIDEELLRNIHVRAAELSMSTQQYITELIERNLYPERFPQLSTGQLEKIWNSTQEIEKAIDDITDVLQEDYVQAEGGMEMTMGQ